MNATQIPFWDLASQVPEGSFAHVALTWMNPFAYTLNTWMCIMLAKLCGEAVVEGIFDFVVGTIFKIPLMPSREPVPVTKGLEKMEPIDWAMVGINQFIELAWLMNFWWWGANKGVVGLENLTLLNTVVGFYACFFVNDFLYYWGHRAMHHPLIYAYVHKHHHRQVLPTRAYLDGVNVHPVESYIALGYIFVTYKIVDVAIGGLHGLTCLAFFAAYSLYGLANHARFDLSFKGLVGHSARTHETHHRFSSCNYAQSAQIYDKMFGTYREYSAGSDVLKAKRSSEMAKEAAAKKALKAE